MVEEYKSIMKNNVWDVVPRPENKSVVGLRWIFKVKNAAYGSIEKCKARFVAKGFSKVEGIDYEEKFYPIARYSSIRSNPALAAKIGWKIHQMDVKTTFSMGLSRRMCTLRNHMVLMHLTRSLICALYGLKQAPHAWYNRIDNYLIGLGFTKSEVDENLHHILVEGKFLIIVLYVDD